MDNLARVLEIPETRKKPEVRKRSHKRSKRDLAIQKVASLIIIGLSIYGIIGLSEGDFIFPLAIGFALLLEKKIVFRL
jgi:hypothetical protein